MGIQQQQEKPLLTWGPEDLAPIFKRAVSTIRLDTVRRPWTLPPFIRVESRILWLPSTVMAWLKEREFVAPWPQRQAPRKKRGAPTKVERIARQGRVGGAS